MCWNKQKQNEEGFQESVNSLRELISHVLNFLNSSGQTSGINHALMHIMKFFDADRAYIGLFDETDCIVDICNEVTNEDISSLYEDLLRRLHKEDAPWWIDKISKGEDIVINDVACMLPQSCKEQKLLQMQDIYSLIAIPIFYEGKVRGFIGLDAVREKRTWTEGEMENLRVLANILAIAIDRKQAKGQIQKDEVQKQKNESDIQSITEELVKIKEADTQKSVFIANMSHEIRTPLNAIVGFSDILTESDDLEERQIYLDIIHKNNDLLLQLINDILDFSKIEAGRLDYTMGVIDLRDICGQLAISGSIKTRPGVSLLFDRYSPSIILKTDEKRVTQVITNFINNAIKFTEQGSITLSYEKIDNMVKVCVKDTGIGINDENQKLIFDRFVKVNTYQQGTGLGLTISKTIVEYLGGTIGVESEEGKGSTFWFTLPLNSDEAQQE